MKYSLMSLMISDEIRVTKPSFIHVAMANGMGYQGNMTSLEDMLAFFNSLGIPMKNGTMSFEDCVRFAKESGFDGIDMMSYHFEESGEYAKEVLEKYGMTMSAINLIVPFVNADTQEKFDACFAQAVDIINRAAAAGCTTVMLMPTVYAADEGITREQAFWNMVKGLRACVDYGEKMGVTISTETLESIGVPLCSNGEMQRLFKEVPGLKYTHDAGNPMVAMEDPLSTYQMFRNQVSTVHFKDVELTEDPRGYMTPVGTKLIRSTLGEGLIDFKAHLQAMQEAGYEGYIALEGDRPAQNALEGAKMALNYVKSLEAQI